MRTHTRKLQRALTVLDDTPSTPKLQQPKRSLKMPPKRLNSTLPHSLMVDVYERTGGTDLTSTRDTMTARSNKQALLLASEVASLDLSKVMSPRRKTTQTTNSRRESIKPLFVAQTLRQEKKVSKEEKMIQKFNQACRESGQLIVGLFQKK